MSNRTYYVIIILQLFN